MKELEKTKEQLIEETEALRRRVAELESKIAASESKAARTDSIPKERAPRTEINASIEFIADFDIVEAKGINFSDSGICFELNEDLPFEMQFSLEGKIHRYRACLVWVKRMCKGGYRFGMQFVPPEAYPRF